MLSQGVAQRTHVDLVESVCSESGDMHDSFPLPGLPNDNQPGSTTQGGKGRMEGRLRGVLGRLDEGKSFERGYFDFVSYLSSLRVNFSSHTSLSSSMRIRHRGGEGKGIVLNLSTVGVLSANPITPVPGFVALGKHPAAHAFFADNMYPRHSNRALQRQLDNQNHSTMANNNDTNPYSSSMERPFVTTRGSHQQWGTMVSCNGHPHPRESSLSRPSATWEDIFRIALL
jgi:hypothetical protein